ncbi:hypothetical protein AX16_002797 [Volvariella volvacea WC 439]|nr:hypothetical protein AX16_002797 [Volvariella volvacea WC 439]
MSAPAAIVDGVEQHPLVQEITSLKIALARCQTEVHNAALHQQKLSGDASKLKNRVSLLERENAVLHTEVQVLRKTPHPDVSRETHPAVLQVQQLSLLLREVNTRLSLTEERLLQRSTELAYAANEATKAKHLVEGAYELASRARAREEETKQRSRELERKLKAAEEGRRLSDLVVSEYADLVRSLERKNQASRGSLNRTRSDSSSTQVGEYSSQGASTTTLVDSYAEGKQGLQRLLSEFNSEAEQLQLELETTQTELQVLRTQHEAERKQAEAERAALAKAWVEVEKLRLNDNSAAQMVSRYMKFSQSSIDKLQDALSALKTRHEATIGTLSAQLAELGAQLHWWQTTAEQLNSTVDELGVDIMKEAFNRRREVALRIRILSQGERLRERLHRWIKRSEELPHKQGLSDPIAALEDLTQEARLLLTSFDGSISDDIDISTGSLSRIIAAEIAVEALAQELQAETMRRLELEKSLAQRYPIPPQDTPHRAPSDIVHRTKSMAPDSNARNQVHVADVPVPSHNVHNAPSITVHAGSTHLSTISDLQSNTTIETPESPPHAAASIPLITVDDPRDSLQSDPVEPLAEEAVVQSTPTSTPLPINVPFPEEVLNVPVNGQDANVASHGPTQLDQPTDDHLSTPPPPRLADHGPREPDSLSTAHEVVLEESSQPEAEPAAGESPERIPVLQPPQQELSPIQLSANLLDTNSYSGHEEPNKVVIEPTPESITKSASERKATPPPHIQITTPGLLLIHEPNGEPSVPDVPQQPSPGHEENESHGSYLTTPSPEAPVLNTVHPLLELLVGVERRYDDLSKAFRDCHVALEGLKDDIKSLSAAETDRISRHLPPELTRAALERLDDSTEDARVELEIRKADEALLIEGYKTLLSLPDASSMDDILPSSFLSLNGGPATQGPPSRSEMEPQIEAFISGADPSVQKTQQTLSKKLDDIQHDIAVLKRFLHDPDFFLDPQPEEEVKPRTSNSWTSWIRNSPALMTKSLPASGHPPPPTFGNVMTTPRLRHSPSLNHLSTPSRHPTASDNRHDPFAALGLKIPMPSHLQPPPVLIQPSVSSESLPAPRPRTVSTMYMLGIGSRTVSGPLGIGAASPRPRVLSSMASSSTLSLSVLPRADADEDIE